MVTEIPRAQWEPFCRAFSGQHRHWLISVGEVLTELAVGDRPLDGPGARLLGRDLPLHEVRIAPGPPRAAEPVLLVLAGDVRRPTCFQVAAPRALRLELTETGAHRGLRIDLTAGVSTLVRFRTPAAPEMVDGQI